MEIDYKYAVQENGGTEYKARTLKVNRSQFQLPTEENDHRFNIYPAAFKRFQQSLAKHKKADKNTFAEPKYKWEKTVPLLENCTWNQFATTTTTGHYNSKFIGKILGNT